MEWFVFIHPIAEGVLASSPYCTGGKCYEVVSTTRTRNSAASHCDSDRKIRILHKYEFILGLTVHKRSCGKVVFLHLSVILFMGGRCTPPGQTHPPTWADTLPPWADTPLGRHTPWADTPPRQAPPLGRHPLVDTPRADPPRADPTQPPSRWPPQRMVRISVSDKLLKLTILQLCGLTNNDNVTYCQKVA